ncbi:hypothetical protein BD560DRAFT_429860 [Blakeslea trispora]|nr:hypothetical protein BD560DRAFT_429860 [Blakeslea trispora]
MQLFFASISVALLAVTVSAAPASEVLAASASVSDAASASMVPLDYASVIASMMDASGPAVSAVPMEYFMTSRMQKRWSWDSNNDDSNKGYHAEDEKLQKWEGSGIDQVYHVWHDEDLKKKDDEDYYGLYDGEDVSSLNNNKKHVSSEGKHKTINARYGAANAGSNYLPVVVVEVPMGAKLESAVDSINVAIATATQSVQAVALFEGLGINGPIGPGPMATPSSI